MAAALCAELDSAGTVERGENRHQHRRDKCKGVVTQKCADKGGLQAEERWLMEREAGRNGERKKKWNGLGSNPFVVFVVVLGQRCFRPWGNFLILSQWADGWHIFLITSLSVIDYSCLTPLPQAVSLILHTATFAPNAVWTPEYRICLFAFLLSWALSRSVHVITVSTATNCGSEAEMN